jgi:hypothetical protein
MYLANDIDAPDSTLDIRGSYKTRKVRLFDDAGTQTAYMYSANPAWCILDLIIHRILKPHGLINEALTADEKAEIDFESFYEAAQYCAADPGDGNARFECHVAFTDQCTVQQALNQMLLTCRGYIIDRNGKIALFVDRPRSSVYTVTRDMIADGSLSFPKKDTRNLANSLIVKYPTLNQQRRRGEGLPDGRARMSGSGSPGRNRARDPGDSRYRQFTARQGAAAREVHARPLPEVRESGRAATTPSGDPECGQPFRPRSVLHVRGKFCQHCGACVGFERQGQSSHQRRRYMGQRRKVCPLGR